MARLVPNKILDKIWAAFPASIKGMINVEVELDDPVTKTRYTPRKSSYFARLQLAEPSGTTLFLVFDLSLAITCAGRLVMMPDGAIREKVAKDDLADDDLDAMGECANNFCVAINDGVQAVLGSGYRTVFKEGLRTPPELDGIGSYVVASAKLALGDYAKGTMSLIVPKDAFEIAEAGEEEDEPDDDDDDDEDDDEPEAVATEDAPKSRKRKPAADEGDARKKKRKKKKKRAADEDDDDDDDQDDDDDDDDRRAARGRGGAGGMGIDLSPEELAAIREATGPGAMAGGKALVVVPLSHDREAWSELLAGSGLEFEFIGDRHQLAQALRAGDVSGVVIDADACAAGGLGELALLRGRAGRSMPRVVVASRPTRTHLVSCLAAGATGYMPKPVLPAALLEQLAR